MTAKEKITRRNLPHWYVPGAASFVTFRLDGTLPQGVLERLRAERQREMRALGKRSGLAAERDRLNKKWFARYDVELDRGLGPTYLQQAPVAALVRRSLYFFHGERYHLLAYCIMPNHVHALFSLLEAVDTTEAPQHADERPDNLSPLAKTMHSLKSYTAHRINELLGRSGVLWQGESYDHWVRDEGELERIVHYIAANPVKAGLVQRPHEWYFCSAHDRFLHDGSSETWLDLPRSTGVPPVQHRRDACATKSEAPR